MHTEAEAKQNACHQAFERNRVTNDRWTGKPRPKWTAQNRTYEGNPCEHCSGTLIVMDCPRCGAPNCCAGCCETETNEGTQP